MGGAGAVCGAKRAVPRLGQRAKPGLQGALLRWGAFLRVGCGCRVRVRRRRPAVLQGRCNKGSAKGGRMRRRLKHARRPRAHLRNAPGTHPRAPFSGCAHVHLDDSITSHSISNMELSPKNTEKRSEKQVARPEPKGGEGVGRSPETFATTHPHT